MSNRLVLLGLVAASLIASAVAAETVTYRYDALGRLTNTFKPDSTFAGLSNKISYDPAGNRVTLSSQIITWKMTAGHSRTSADGRFMLAMQNDGNLVLYQLPGTALWSSSTFGSGYYAQFQTDGNLVVYNSSAVAVWYANVSSPGASLTIRNDGNMEIVSEAGTRVWHTNTCCH